MIIPRTTTGVLFWLGFASILTAAEVPSGKAPQLALGFRDSDHFCIAVSNGHLAPGTHVKIIVPLDKKVGEAVVIEPAKQPCHGTANSPNTSSYELQASKTDVPDTIALVGVIDGLDHIVVSQADITARNSEGKTATVRACLADGGVYLTLWSGKPLEGEVLWHGFRFVDFDMDAENCTSKDEPK